MAIDTVHGRQPGRTWFLKTLGFSLLAFGLMTAIVLPSSQAEEVTFAVQEYQAVGNTLLSADTIQQILMPFTGSHQTAEQVEQARKALEDHYHKAGYPAVLVNIPEQDVAEGVVQLQVIESRIRRVRITGNRYFTMEKIYKALPSFTPGTSLYLPRIQAELAMVNRNPNLKVAPMLAPGKEVGTIDVELHVKDRLPLHGSLELDNRSSHNTSELRLSAMLSYDNLWQKDHSLSFQYQTAPQQPKEVQVVAGSYVLPSPLNADHLLAVYGVWSDSDTAFGEGFQVLGKGTIAGLRLMMPLAPNGSYSHNLTFGIDYKSFDELLNFQDPEQEGLNTPLRYLPLSLTYGGSWPDELGSTRFNIGMNTVFRGWITDSQQFEDKRYHARGNYLVGTLGVARNQQLPMGVTLTAELNGQIADQPLISNEQFAAGGMKKPRGYKETEALGDDALQAGVELLAPDIGAQVWPAKRLSLIPFVFYDLASLSIKEPLPGQEQQFTLQSTGCGFRGRLLEKVEFETVYGIALENTERTDAGSGRVHFLVKFQF